MLYKPEGEKQDESAQDFIERSERNNEQIHKIDDEAKKKNEILHRFLYFPYADGNAVYQIIRVNKRTVRLKVCSGVGDDWVIPMIGEEGTFPLDNALANINRRDAWDIIRGR